MIKLLVFFLMGVTILLGLNYTGFVDWFGSEDEDSVLVDPDKDFPAEGPAGAELIRGHFACLPLPGFGKAEECRFLKVMDLWPDSNQTAQTGQNSSDRAKKQQKNETNQRRKIKSIRGNLLSMKSLRGKALLLNFWASWCAPCREEFPELISAVRWSKGRLALLAVSNDSSLKDIRAFLNDMKKAGVKWDQQDIYIIWDREFELSGTFHVAKWPETFILSAQRSMVKKQAGAFVFSELKPFLSRLLKIL